MKTAERAHRLAGILREFPFLGEISVENLLEVVERELGHPEILDGFRPYAGHFSRAIPREPILHVVSENTPHAALQSLARGLLLGARNFLKLPSGGLPEAEQFGKMAVEAGFSLQMTGGRETAPAMLREAKAVVVFGSDETISHFRKLVPGDAVFEPHGHRISLGMVFDDPRGESAPLAARDVSLFNQKGCLSPQDIYVAGDARGYAMHLAREMEQFHRKDPRGPVTPYEAAQIADMRANYRFRSANDPRVQIWESAGGTDWTVIYEEDPWFAASCLNRVVFVKPLPDDPAAALGPALDWLAAIGLWPATPEYVEKLAGLRPSRFCTLGRMQDAPFSWHQEGRQTLAPLVQWVDFQP